MIGALVYLQFISLRNAVRARLRRLRQPRYIFATLAGAAYFYFFFFRHVGFRGNRPPGPEAMPVEVGLMVGVAMVVLMMVGRLVYAWVFSADRAALAFTEAEVAFLFPAPVNRRMLVNFKLARSQLRVLFSAVLLALLSDRFTFIGGNMWTHAVGLWILFSTLELHGIAAAFTRDRLLDLGLNPVRRRLVFGGALLLVAMLLWWAVQRIVPAPTAADAAGLPAFVHYVLRTVLAVPLVSWVSAPFRWVLGPFFAPAGVAFWRALGPALAVLAAHYVWVIRSEVSFEEASIELARRRAQQIAAVRAGGGWRSLRRPTRRRREPFALRPSGARPLAFLWRNLISAGQWFYPRTWLWIAAGVLGATLWLAANPVYRPWLRVAQQVVPMAGIWVLIFVPMFMRRQVQLLLDRLEVVKTYPLRGWQVVIGEMLAPIALMTAIEWLLLAVEAVAGGALTGRYGHAVWLTGFGAVEIGLLVPPVAGLMTAIPLAATLQFPGWMSTLNQPRGMESFGQRLIFSGGFVLAFAGALLPAALVAAGPFFLVQWLSGSLSLALLAGGVSAALVLAGELAGVVWWLGRRYERFDLAVELPQG